MENTSISIAGGNLSKRRSEMLKFLILLFVTGSVYAASLIEKLQEEEPKGVSPCVVQGQPLVCIFTEMDGEQYAIAGVLKDGDFYAGYIFKNVNGKAVLVWKHGDDL